MPVYILAGLLVVCVFGFAFLYSTQSGVLSDLQTSEDKLTSEVESLKSELSDKESEFSVLSSEKQSLTNEVSSLESENKDTKQN